MDKTDLISLGLAYLGVALLLFSFLNTFPIGVKKTHFVVGGSIGIVIYFCIVICQFKSKRKGLYTKRYSDMYETNKCLL